MPALTLIAAVARNGVIGQDNRLPWQLPEDMAHFKALTTGHAVIMGRKTWDSLPPKFRPLPQRTNIVVTRDPTFRAPGATVVHALPAAIAAAGQDAAFVIGGAEIYGLALPLADRIEFTEVELDCEGDAFFPAFDRGQWREVARERGQSANGLGYAFVTYQRIREN
ncbi:MAG: dihydrofolate reductase [Ignavibacteria bacterium]